MSSRLVLLLPEDGEQLVETVSSLRDRQLVSEPILVSPGQSVDECVAQILSGAAEQKLDYLRLIALRFQGSVDEAQWNREREIADVVATACNAGQVRFIRGVVADTSATVLDETSFHIGWDFNLIIEPEDSIGEAGFLAAPLSVDNGASSAAAAAALVGGLFGFLSEGVLDGWKESSSDNMLRVRLARWHLRIVDVRDLTGEVVDLALNEGSHWHKPDEFISHPNSETVMADLADQTSTALRFNYERMGPAGGPSNVKLGIFSAIRLYFRRLSQMMGRVVQAMSDEIGNAFAESMSSLAQGVTFGSNSRVQVVMGQLKGDERLPLGPHWRDDRGHQLLGVGNVEIQVVFGVAKCKLGFVERILSFDGVIGDTICFIEQVADEESSQQKLLRTLWILNLFVPHGFGIAEFFEVGFNGSFVQVFGFAKRPVNRFLL